MNRVILSGAVASALLVAMAGFAQEPAAQRGEGFVQANCARCHAIGLTGDSPMSQAPPFRAIHLRYPIDNLEEALGEGIRTSHRAMPEFVLNSHQVQDLIAYLRSLEQ